MHAMPGAAGSWPALGVNVKDSTQWTSQQVKELIRLNLTHMLAADEGKRHDTRLPKLGRTHLGRTQKAIGQDTEGIWAGHRRHLGRTQKAFRQDTQGVWAGHSRHLGRTQKAFRQDTQGNAHTSYSKHCQQGLLGVNKGEPSVDEVAQICQQLVVVLGGQITPLKVGV